MKRLGGISAAIGGLAWCALFAIRLEEIERLFLLAPLVIVPLGLALVGTKPAAILQPVAAASFFFPQGRTAAILALPWLALTGLVALGGGLRLLKRGIRPVQELAIDFGMLYLPVGGAWLVISRYGATPMGFQPTIVLLTAVHFHYTGFAAPILAGLAGRAWMPDGGRRVYAPAVIGLLGGTPLLAAGITLSPHLEVAAAFLVTLSLVLLSGVTFFGPVRAIRNPLARLLLTLSAGSILPSMGFAAAFAVGEFLRRPIVTIPQMARFHGEINAFGFALCGLIGWIIASDEWSA